VFPEFQLRKFPGCLNFDIAKNTEKYWLGLIRRGPLLYMWAYITHFCSSIITSRYITTSHQWTSLGRIKVLHIRWSKLTYALGH
jgi:hypothetical protein